MTDFNLNVSLFGRGIFTVNLKVVLLVFGTPMAGIL